MKSEAMAELSARLAERERHTAALRARIGELERELAAAKLRHAAQRDLWGVAATGVRLSLLPLVAAIAGAVAANAAAFCGFVVLLTRWSAPAWSLFFLLATALAGGSYLFSRGEGAGGRARVGLRRMTIVLLALAVVFAGTAAITPAG